MNLNEVKAVVYSVVSLFFSGACVIWAEQINTTPPLPYVTLKVSGINKSRVPIVNKDDFNEMYYPSSTTLEVNLYTAGKPVTDGSDGEQVTGNCENTAMSDLNDFFNFAESEYMTDFLTGKGVDISLIPPIRDLTTLQNNREYRYRAMAEATISFSQEANNAYGVGYMTDIPNSSGGGIQKLAETPIEPIRKVVTKCKGGTGE